MRCYYLIIMKLIPISTISMNTMKHHRCNTEINMKLISIPNVCTQTTNFINSYHTTPVVRKCNKVDALEAHKQKHEYIQYLNIIEHSQFYSFCKTLMNNSIAIAIPFYNINT